MKNCFVEPEKIYREVASRSHFEKNDGGNSRIHLEKTEPTRAQSGPPDGGHAFGSAEFSINDGGVSRSHFEKTEPSAEFSKKDFCVNRNHLEIPWIEKYRPQYFDHIVLEPHNRQLFNNIIHQNTSYFPHLLLYGPPGTGKTTTIINLVNEYQKQAHSLSSKNGAISSLGSNLIHLNGSDDRGIDIIRNQIHLFISSCNLFDTGLKFVILDEVDYMTKSAQQALKYILQTFMFTNVRFFLICNYISKIDESLQKEFVCVQFNQLPNEDIFVFLKNICEKEKMEWTDEQLRNLMNLYPYDIRSMINFLQINQQCILDESILWKIEDMFSKVNQRTELIEFIRDISCRYNINEKEIIQRYYEHVLPKRITTEWLDTVEIIMHNTENEMLLEMFVWLESGNSQ